MDLVPRQGAHMVDPDTMSVVELYHVVIRTKQNLNNNRLSQMCKKNMRYHVRANILEPIRTVDCAKRKKGENSG